MVINVSRVTLTSEQWTYGIVNKSRGKISSQAFEYFVWVIHIFLWRWYLITEWVSGRRELWQSLTKNWQDIFRYGTNCISKSYINCVFIYLYVKLHNCICIWWCSNSNTVFAFRCKEIICIFFFFICKWVLVVNPILALCKLH